MDAHVRSNLMSPPVLWRPRRLLQNHENLLHPIQIGLSVLASVLVLLALARWHEGHVDQSYRVMAIIAALLMVVIYEWRGIYRRFKGRVDGGLRLLRAWVLVVLAVILSVFMARLATGHTRQIIIEWAALGYLLQIAGYQVSYKISQRIKVHYGKPIRAVVIGSRWLAEHLVASFTCNSWMPDRIIGIIDDDVALEGECLTGKQIEVSAE